MKEFNKAKYVIDKSRMSQYKIAAETGISQGNISRLRRGERKIENLSFSNIIKLANLYDQEYK